MQDSTVSTVYRNVIDDVIARVKLDFVQEGVDEAVLDELRVLWETKLQQSGVLESDISASQPATGVYDASQILPYPSFLSTVQGVHSQPLSPAVPQQYYNNALSGLPPQHIGQFQAPKQEQHLNHRPGFATPSVQFPMVGSYTLAASDVIAAATDRPVITPADPSSAAYGGSSLAPTGIAGAVVDTRKRKADDPLDAYGGHQRVQQPLPTHTAQIPQYGSIPQQDGSDDPAEPEKEETDNLSDVSSDKEEEEDCPNVVIAQFEKVSRTKSRWKCQLKDGIITINGQDYLFHRASGEMQF